MSSVYLNPAGPARARRDRATGQPQSHRMGNAVRAVSVFARAAFGVAVLGEYEEEAGIVRRHH